MARENMRFYKQTVIDALSGQDIMRSAELEKLGIPRMALMRLKKEGVIASQGYGFYSLPSIEAPNPYDILTKNYPDGVFCFNTAQAFHDLHDGDKSIIHMALPPEQAVKASTHLPGVETLKIISWSDPKFHTVGVETVELQGYPVKMTNFHRSIVDMLRPDRHNNERNQPEEREQALTKLIIKEGKSGLLNLQRCAEKLGFDLHLATMKPVLNALYTVASHKKESNACPPNSSP